MMVLRGLYKGGNNSEEDNDREKHFIRNMKCNRFTQWRIVKREGHVKEDGQSAFTVRSSRTTSKKMIFLAKFLRSLKKFKIVAGCWW